MTSPPVPRTYPSGVPSWVDTDQPDVDAALAFYGGLLGWEFTEATPAGAADRYVIAQLAGQDVAAVGTSGGGSAGWHTYVATDDADATTARLVAVGAELVGPPADAGPGGRLAVLRDPEGAEFRLWQARRRLGAQRVNAPGTWNFSDLHAADPAAAERFYGSAFGWTFASVGPFTAASVPGYGDHLAATSDPGIRVRQASAPPGFADVVAGLVPLGEDEVPHWHVSFAVEDREQTTARAVELGATVVSTEESLWYRRVTLRDPQGAVFTASQFTPPG